MSDKKPNVLVIYRPQWKKKKVYRYLGMANEESWEEWGFAGLEKYDGYTDSQTGAEVFISDHMSEDAAKYLKVLAYPSQYSSWQYHEAQEFLREMIKEEENGEAG